MELEEMKASWEILSQKIEKQEKLTTQMIETMTQQNFKSKLNKIGYWEYGGTIICFASVIYLVANFAKISHVYVQVFAVICMAILFILPIISLNLLKGMSSLHISTRSYTEAVKTYTYQKVRFQKFQKFNFLFGLVLIVLAMPVLMEIQGKNLNKVHYYWGLMFPVMLLFFVLFATWVLRYYNRTLEKAEQILSELES